jgi:hypothetical protein
MSFTGKMSVVKAELAWESGDRPDEPDFGAPVSRVNRETLARFLSSVCGWRTEDIGSIRALRETPSLAGRYCVSVRGRNWFVRVTTRWGDPELERSIVSYLHACDAPVIPFLHAGLELKVDDARYRTDVRPLIPGRHYSGSTADSLAIARALATCHRLLAGYPRRDDVREKANERVGNIADAWKVIARACADDDYSVFGPGSSWARENKAWLEEIGSLWEPVLHQHHDAQVLHGEIHPANILFAAEDNRPVLLDFEESVSMFAPPSWDLAYFVQRFVLRDDELTDVRNPHVSDVLSAYGADAPDLYAMMRQAAASCIGLYVHLTVREQVSTPVSELEKFYRLDRQAAALQAV